MKNKQWIKDLVVLFGIGVSALVLVWAFQMLSAIFKSLFEVFGK